MEAVIFDGKEYLKASVVAERFNYTQDYIGQLCRGKKVDARLVGRAWYINLESLESHRSSRYKVPARQVAVQKNIPVVAPLAQPRGNYLSRIDVEPVLKKKTVKILQNRGGSLTELPVKYESDDYSLIPSISREAIHKPIPVLPAEAEEMRVRATKESVRVTSFKAESLPEVYLEGVLKVDGIEEAMEEEFAEMEKQEIPKEIAVEHIQKSHEGERLTSQRSHFESDSSAKKPLKIKLYRNSEDSAPVAHHVSLPRPHTNPTERQVSAQHLSQRTQLAEKNNPKSILTHSIKAHNTALDASPAVKSPKTDVTDAFVPFATIKALLIFLCCFFLAGALLSLEMELRIQEKSTAKTWAFSFEKIIENIVQLEKF